MEIAPKKSIFVEFSVVGLFIYRNHNYNFKNYYNQHQQVRDKNNKNDPTMSPLTIKFAGRHGWFYDNPENAKRPGPGRYTLNYTQILCSSWSEITFCF